MKKPKYEKPLSRNLSAMQPAQGSCYTGEPEYPLQGCADGSQAVNCSNGSNVYDPHTCTPTGGHAGYSCISGLDAG